jgi:hypothetical protein
VKYHCEIPLNNEYALLKMKYRKANRFCLEVGTCERDVNGAGKRGRLWLLYFIFFYKNTTMKLVEIALRRCDGDNGE